MKTTRLELTNGTVELRELTTGDEFTAIRMTFDQCKKDGAQAKISMKRWYRDETFDPVTKQECLLLLATEKGPYATVEELRALPREDGLKIINAYDALNKASPGNLSASDDGSEAVVKKEQTHSPNTV